MLGVLQRRARDGIQNLKAESKAALLTVTGHTREVTGAAFSPDESRIVSASGDKTLHVWDAETGTALLTLTEHTFDHAFATMFVLPNLKPVTLDTE